MKHKHEFMKEEINLVFIRFIVKLILLPIGNNA